MAAELLAGGRLRPGLLPRVATIAFVVVALFLSVRFLERALPHYLPKDWAAAHDADGLEDWLVARFYLQGRNPYEPAALEELKRKDIGHPPTTGFWMLPLAKMEKATAAEVIDLTTWLFLLLGLYLCARELKFPAPVAVALLGFSFLLTTDGMVMHWHAIQFSMQIAFALIVAWVCLRRDHEIPAGLALGVAATFKLFPGMLVLMLLWLRRFRAFAAAAAVYLVVAAVMTAGYGLRSWPMFLAQQKGISERWMGSIRSASLQGIVLRLLSPVCGPRPMPSTTATVIAGVAGLTLLVAAVWLSRRTVLHARLHDPTAIDLPFALVTVVAVFLNPWIWEHYHVFLIQPAFVVAARLWGSFRSTLQSWLDEQAPHRTLVRHGLFLLVGVAALVAIGKILTLNVYAKMKLEELWRAHPTPWVHYQMHVMEVLNWAPWVMMIALCMLATWHLSPPRREARS